MLDPAEHSDRYRTSDQSEVRPIRRPRQGDVAVSPSKSRNRRGETTASRLIREVLELAPGILHGVDGPFEVATGYGPAGYVVRLVTVSGRGVTRDFVSVRQDHALRALRAHLVEDAQIREDRSRTVPAPAPCKVEPRPQALPRQVQANDDPSPDTIHSAR